MFCFVCYWLLGVLYVQFDSIKDKCVNKFVYSIAGVHVCHYNHRTQAGIFFPYVASDTN